MQTPGRLRGALSPRKLKAQNKQSPSKYTADAHVHFQTDEIPQSPSEGRKTMKQLTSPPDLSVNGPGKDNAEVVKDTQHSEASNPVETQTETADNKEGEKSEEDIKADKVFTPTEKGSSSRTAASSENAEPENDNDSSFLAISQSIRRSQKVSGGSEDGEGKVSTTSFLNSATDDTQRTVNTPKSESATSLSVTEITEEKKPAEGGRQDETEEEEAVYEAGHEEKNTDFKQNMGDAMSEENNAKSHNDNNGDASGEDNDTDGGSDSDEDIRTVNRSTLGFAGLPAREPLTKKSFAKTPSSTLSQSSKNKPFASISKMRHHPTSFETKLEGGGDMNWDNNEPSKSNGDNGPEYPDTAAASRLSIHYPEISQKESLEESKPNDTNISIPDAEQKSDLPVHQNSSIKSISTTKAEEAELSQKQSSPVRNPPTMKTNNKTISNNSLNSPMKITVSPMRKDQKHSTKDEKNQPARSPSKKGNHNLSPQRATAESPRIERLVNEDSNSNQIGYSPGGTLMSLTAGVFRRAKQLLFDPEADQQMGDVQDEDNTKTDNNNTTKPRTASRLMAPTASSTRHAANSPKKTVGSDFDSPLAEKKSGYIKSLYPELPRVASQKKLGEQQSSISAPTKVVETPSGDPFKDAAKDIPEDVKTATTYPSDSTDSQSHTAREGNTPAAKSGNKLTKQTLQAKKPGNPPQSSASSTQSKPLTIKVSTSSQKEIEQQKKKAQAQQSTQQQTQQSSSVANASTSAGPGVTTSLAQKPLSVNKQASKVVKKKEDTTTVKAPPPQHTQTQTKKSITAADGKQLPLRGAASKTEVNAKANNSTSASNFKKRTSDQVFDTPVENKAARVSKTNQPLKKPSQGSQNNSLMKTTMIQQAKHHNGANNSSVPHVEGVKFSNDKIRFGNPSSASQSANNSQQAQRPAVAAAAAAAASASSSIPTPQAKGNAFRQVPTISYQTQQQQPSSLHSTPKPQDPVELPEIMSESEDDDDGNVLKDWANSPELHNMLMNQQKVDPDSIFGPIPPLQIEEVFKNSRLSRFRPRSSSANWTNQDKLSQQEVERYAYEMGYKNPGNNKK